MAFSKDFFWGGATASNQYEGGVFEGGAGLSTALSETVSFCILLWMYLSGRATTRISVRLVSFDPAKLFDFESQDVKADFYVFKGRGRGTLLGKHDANSLMTGEELAQAAEEDVTYNSSETTASSHNRRAASNNRIHKVRRGETLSTIARKHHTTVAKLCRANGISTRTKLRVGQILKYS